MEYSNLETPSLNPPLETQVHNHWTHLWKHDVIIEPTSGNAHWNHCMVYSIEPTSGNTEPERQVWCMQWGYSQPPVKIWTKLAYWRCNNALCSNFRVTCDTGLFWGGGDGGCVHCSIFMEHVKIFSSRSTQVLALPSLQLWKATGASSVCRRKWAMKRYSNVPSPCVPTTSSHIW